MKGNHIIQVISFLFRFVPVVRNFKKDIAPKKSFLYVLVFSMFPLLSFEAANTPATDLTVILTVLSFFNSLFQLIFLLWI